MQEVNKLVEAAVKAACGVNVPVSLDRPDEKFGDYASNIALQLSKKLAKNPREIAEEIVKQLQNSLIISEVSIAGPGFINIKMTDKFLRESIKNSVNTRPTQYKDKVVVVEYSDPNPFKVLHAGHIYTTVVGDGIAKLLEVAGAKVHRVNFGGDVGMHVAKTMWVMLQKLGGEHPEKLAEIPEKERSVWMAGCYVEGNNLFESDGRIKIEMVALNKKIYRLHNENEKSSLFAQIYWTTRAWSYQAFDDFYGRLGTKMEKYYPESEVAELGLETVKAQLKKGVFKESEGAVIFEGEKYDLHNRVFINSEGLPTYEAKDIGVILQKYDDYHFDKSLVITDNEQQQYMAVITKAVEQFAPNLAAASMYIPHGKLKLTGGIKMSSRKGNIIRATEVLDVTAEAIRVADRNPNDTVILAAIKYAFLKYRIGGDVVYDPEESVSLQGNSGPYLQYAHARACSVLAKAGTTESTEQKFEPMERKLARKICEYPDVVAAAVDDLMPHHIANYLYELAQEFNRFYEKNRVVDDPRQNIRTLLVRHYTNVLKDGLQLMNISAPEKM